MRKIDADALLELLEAWKDESQKIGAEINNMFASAMISQVNAMPTIEPEIVRCKDCTKREICRTSTTWAVAPKDDWYCADAERRTDGRD